MASGAHTTAAQSLARLRSEATPPPFPIGLTDFDQIEYLSVNVFLLFCLAFGSSERFRPRNEFVRSFPLEAYRILSQFPSDYLFSCVIFLSLIDKFSVFFIFFTKYTLKNFSLNQN